MDLSLILRTRSIPFKRKQLTALTVSQKTPFGILAGKAKTKTQKGKALEHFALAQSARRKHGACDEYSY